MDPTHTWEIRVGGKSMVPAAIPALAHIRRTASGAAASASCRMISDFVRYHPMSLAVTVPSSPTVRITPEKTSRPWFTTRSLSPGSMPYQCIYLSRLLFRTAVKVSSTLRASNSSRASGPLTALVMSVTVLPLHSMKRWSSTYCVPMAPPHFAPEMKRYSRSVML